MAEEKPNERNRMPYNSVCVSNQDRNWIIDDFEKDQVYRLLKLSVLTWLSARPLETEYENILNKDEIHLHINLEVINHRV